jgi:hypothetical protein
MGFAGLFLSILLLTGFMPVFPLFQGSVEIGRIPLIAAWWMSRWVSMGLHLLLAASLTGAIVIGWRVARSKGRFSLKTLLLLMTLVAAIVVLFVVLPGGMTFRNG